MTRREGTEMGRFQRAGQDKPARRRRWRQRRWQGGQRRPQIMSFQTQGTGMRGNATLFQRVLERMRIRAELGENEQGNEEEMPQERHDFNIDRQSTWTSSPLRYSPSGKFSATG